MREAAIVAIEQVHTSAFRLVTKATQLATQCLSINNSERNDTIERDSSSPNARYIDTRAMLCSTISNGEGSDPMFSSPCSFG